MNSKLYQAQVRRVFQKYPWHFPPRLRGDRVPEERVRSKRISWRLRLTTWGVLVTHVLSPFNPQIMAAETNAIAPTTATSTSSPPDPVLTPSNVSVNRTVPAVQPPSQELRFSESPTDEEIFNARVFSEPIMNVGTNQSGSIENGELAQALIAFRNRATPEDVSALEAFLAKYPASPKRASVLLGAASVYRKTGQLTKAFAAWQEAWALAKNATEGRSKVIAEQTAAELSLFIVSIGRTEPLRDLLEELRGRDIGGSAGEKVVRAREALWQMQNLPDQSFKCGPFSLYRIRANLNLPDAAHKLIWDEQSTSQGTTLAQMWSLGQRMGMDYQMAKRQAEAAVLYPSMMHWKLGHFSALVREDNGRYLIEDTAFGDQIWISRSVLDAEANGYFLAPAGKLPPGWTSVSEDEAKTVWGRMTPTTRDSDATTPDDKTDPPTPEDDTPEDPPTPKEESDSGGDGKTVNCDEQFPTPMAQYSIHLMQVSLNIVDSPVGYAPPRGPAVRFHVTYNQREANQPTTFTYSNVGKKWTFDWLSYVEDDPGNPNANVKVYTRGGGAEPFKNFDTNTQTYAVQQKTQSRLVRTSTNAYERIYPNGAKEIFNLSNGSTNYPRKIFMTRVLDAFDNGITNTFDANFRIVSVTDALGQVTTLTYGSTNLTNDLFYKISQVTDPFGRYATFQYNASGQLTNITDVIGIKSSFTYDGVDFITSMTTPYGTTSFTKYEYDLDRWIEVTEPDGEKRRVEFKYQLSSMASSEPSFLFPAGMAVTNDLNLYLNTHNTFVWDKKAMREAPGDYTKARLTRWLTSPESFYVISGIPHSEKSPLEQRVWYNYPGQTHGRMGGTSDQPSHIARILDDGTTQLTQFEYNTYGKLTKVVDPLGRTTLSTYSTNGIDLLEVRQQVGSTNELLNTFTYNTQHLQLTAVDAAGQTNRFGYNAYGQLTAVTNAINEVTSLSYSNGHLTNVLGALPGATTSLTYDGYGRVRTVTDSEGYTVTYDYDVLDRRTKTTYPDGTFKQVVYEKLDPVFRRDRRGHWSRTIYNAVRKPTAIEDAAGRVTHLDWCGCGGLSSIVDPLGRATTLFRDIQGRVTSKVYPDNTAVTYAYESWSGRLKTVTDAKNQTTWYDYYKDNALKQGKRQVKCLGRLA